MAGLIATMAAIAVFFVAVAMAARHRPAAPPRVNATPVAPKPHGLTQRQQNWLYGLGAALLATVCGKAIFGAWGMGLIFSIVGVGAPGWILYRRRERRRARMAEQLEQLMGRLANSMAGSNATPEMAWLEAAAEVGDPLGSVLHEIARALQVGVPLEEALLQQSHYLGIPEFELVAQSTAVLSGMGGNLAERYRRIADMIGERRSARATLHSLTLDTRLNGHIVSAVPFIAFAGLRYIVPHYVQPVLASPGGQIVLGFGSALVLGGWFWMLRIADVERLE